MKIKEKRHFRGKELKVYDTPFKIKKTFLGWFFILISIGLMIAGGILYITMGG